MYLKYNAYFFDNFEIFKIFHSITGRKFDHIDVVEAHCFQERLGYIGVIGRVEVEQLENKNKTKIFKTSALKLWT